MESFLILVAEKIAVAMAGEAIQAAMGFNLGAEESLKTEVKETIRRIRSEFEHMQIFLSSVDMQKYNTTIEPWLKRAREIADSMEDVIDEYLHITVERSQGGLRSFFNQAVRSHKKSSAWNLIANRLKVIEAGLSHLEAMKDRYDIRKNESEVDDDDAEGENANGLVGRVFNSSRSNPVREEDDNIYREQRKILFQLLTDETSTRTVISVWGMGGVGKTTMVDKVYGNQEIENRFDCKIWVTVSKSCRIEHSMRRILKELLDADQSDHDSNGSSDLNRLQEDVCSILQEKRYLLILDDVWSGELSSYVQRALPDNNRGSRIVITTRLNEVASTSEERHRLKLRKIEDEGQAFDLFCREVFWHADDRRCPKHLETVGRNIVRKCQGLPLAIVAVARLMSLKGTTEAEWQRVYKKLSWEFANNPSLDNLKHVLNLSYDDLPSYLKNCFLYCSVFPDYKIKRKKLIRLWIAESFVQDRETQTVEEVAEEFLEELVHRSMLHGVQRNSFGRVRRCGMHGLMRELTLPTARKENFSMVWKESESSGGLGCEARRLSVHDYAANSALFHMDFSRIRSLLVFKHDSSLTTLLKTVSRNARYLRVVDLESADMDKVPDVFMDLINLHYLGLRKTKVKRLPDSIGRLRNLQTLDLRYTKIEKLPKGISQLRKLRYLLALRLNDRSRRSFEFVSHVKAPGGLGLQNLTSLQHLDIAADEESSMRQLGYLTQLKVLIVSKVKGVHCPLLSASVSHMTSLYKLSITAYDEKEVLQLQDLGHCFQNLQKLHVQGTVVGPVVVQEQRCAGMRRGREGGVVAGGGLHVHDSPLLPPSFRSLGERLRELCLGWSGLKEDPLPALCHLHNLSVLFLRQAYHGLQLRFKEGWFPNLQELHLLHLPYVNRMVIEKGSMKSLRLLQMEGLSELMLLPKGIEHLTSLHKLYLSECNNFFLYAIQEDQRKRVDHIPNIWHAYLADGKKIIEILSRPTNRAPRPQEEEEEDRKSVPPYPFPTPSETGTDENVYSYLPPIETRSEMNDRGTSNSFPSPRKEKKTNWPTISEHPSLSGEQPEFVPVVDDSSQASDFEEEEQNNKADDGDDDDKFVPSFPTQSEMEIRDKVDSHLDQSKTKMEITQSETEICDDKVDSHLDQSKTKMEVTQSETEIRDDKVDSHLDRSKTKMEVTQSETEIRDDKVDSHLDRSEAKMEMTQSEIDICDDKVDSHLDQSEAKMEVTERRTSDSDTKPPEKMMTNLPTISEEADEEAELVPTVDGKTVNASDGE
ncbi:disease resistance protein RPM1 [Musa acuminata AAA Group]|uniref:disease resistance protein RPM1 n=1 Tax=Musa acuminata AAA Group TaxID=214697 RepID=UPI0031DC0896